MLKQNPENRRIFDEENELWQEASFTTKLEKFKPDTAWKDLSNRLGFDKSTGKSLLNYSAKIISGY